LRAEAIREITEVGVPAEAPIREITEVGLPTEARRTNQGARRWVDSL
jgi:hypothetical protein